MEWIRICYPPTERCDSVPNGVWTSEILDRLEALEKVAEAARSRRYCCEWYAGGLEKKCLVHISIDAYDATRAK